MSYDLHLARVRKALAARREPYWGAPLARGQHLGLRVLPGQDRMTWIARYRDDATGKQNYKSLGWLTVHFDYEAARTAALAWFKNIALGVTSDVVTVEKACRDYVDERRSANQGRTCGTPRRALSARSMASLSGQFQSTNCARLKLSLGGPRCASRRPMPTAPGGLYVLP